MTILKSDTTHSRKACTLLLVHFSGTTFSVETRLSLDLNLSLRLTVTWFRKRQENVSTIVFLWSVSMSTVVMFQRRNIPWFYYLINIFCKFWCNTEYFCKLRVTSLYPVSYTHLDVYKRQQPVMSEPRKGNIWSLAGEYWWDILYFKIQESYRK